MSFTPDKAARFEGPIINNVIAFVARDMKPALDYFYASDALPDFAERSIGIEKGFEFPIFVIGPRENPIERADDDSHLVEDQRIDIRIGVIADSSDAAYQKIMKYVQALDAVLRSASKDDYCANMGSGNNAPFDLQVDVRHTYGPLGQDERGTYFKPALLELTVAFRQI